MTNNNLTNERIAQYANDPLMCVSEEVREMARTLLAGRKQEPLGYYSAEMPEVLNQRGYASIAAVRSGECRYSLYAAPQLVPEGWRLVPEEATPDMIAAAMDCDDVEFNSDGSFCVNFDNIYTAMLAAADSRKVVN